MIIAIPSKGRADAVKSQAILTSARVFVPKLEAPAYQRMGVKNVVAVPDDVVGITRTRNWILKNTKDRRVVMIDDDVRAHGFTHLYERHAVHEPLDEKTWLSEFAKLFDVTEQLGFRIWGVRTDSATRAAYPYFPFRFRSYVTASCMGIINDGRTYFDETYFAKEDYELCARCITEDGGVLSAQYLFWQNEHWTTKGGCNVLGRSDAERDSVKRLCRTYPGLVRAVEREGANFAVSIG
jgi:hypothetical protein